MALKFYKIKQFLIINNSYFIYILKNYILKKFLTCLKINLFIFYFSFMTLKFDGITYFKKVHSNVYLNLFFYIVTYAITRYTIKIHPHSKSTRSKSTRVQNPPDKVLYFCYLLIYLKTFLNFFVNYLFIFHYH